MSYKLVGDLDVRNAEYAAFIAAAKKYTAIVKDIASSIDPVEYKTIEAMIEKPCDTLRFPEQMDLGAIGDLYNQIANQENAMEIIARFLGKEQYLKMAAFNMSTSYYQSAALLLKSAAGHHKKHIAIVDDFADIYEAITKNNNPNALAEWISSAPLNRFSLWITKQFIKHHPSQHSVINTVEQQKDVALGNRAKQTDGIIRGSQIPLSPFAALNVDDTSMDLYWDVGKSPAENAAENNAAFIEGQAINYNISGLIDHEYIKTNDLTVSAATGITKKFLKKYNTISTILPTNTAESNAVHGVLQMTPTAIRVVSDVPYVNMRAAEYHKLQSPVIMANCYDASSQIVIDKFLAVKSAINPEQIKISILEELITQIMKTNGDLATRKISWNNYRKSIFPAPLIKQIVEANLSKHFGDRRRSQEDRITAKIKATKIIKAFNKNLTAAMYSTDINARIFDELSGPALTAVLTDIIKKIINTALDELDRGDVWSEYNLSFKGFYLSQAKSF